MLLYVNGDSHTAAAEAVNTHAFAEDDTRYHHLGRLPHPDNLEVSWGKKLADLIKMSFFCGAESAASNDRIIRTTTEWIGKYPKEPENLFVVIGWSTWEREEWLINDVYYQVNTSGIDIVPDSHKQKYKQYIDTVDWDKKTAMWHDDIWNFHKWLDNQNIKHIFFNCNNDFNKTDNKKEWNANYINPYSSTYDAYLKEKGHTPLDGYHYDENGHTEWAKFLLKHILKNKLL
jgi:hypothetical protein